ncbi:hypothetical protein [Qipengyuania zhejiangensis]|uniref:hypothetical protein n=1 Tax=Qipengyuania zhejiangensis TaxID=3077782 RepID=UPI002D7721BF|nr:hypothetical protein [Qipengyuania sp. Z2]
MIRRAFPVFAFLMAAALFAFMIENGALPDLANTLRATVFAAIAAPLMRLYWDKRKEQRDRVIARARIRNGAR